MKEFICNKGHEFDEPETRGSDDTEVICCPYCHTEKFSKITLTPIEKVLPLKKKFHKIKGSGRSQGLTLINFDDL